MTGLEVAIVGVAGRFPSQASTPEKFWANILAGKESVKFFDQKELLDLGVPKKTLENPNYIATPGATLEDKFQFDPEFFGYTIDEAMLMDPQTRLLHECVYHALEDAGYAHESYDGRVGLFLGASNNPVWEIGATLSDSYQKLGGWASQHFNDKDFISTLIAHKLNLKGPSMSINTACSTSLVNVHVAIRSLLFGECDLSIAGAVSVSSRDSLGYMHEEGMVRSSSGHCRPFDKNADGIVGGEGGGVLVLKKLKKAIEDRDNIYAVIKGSAVNNDGSRKLGYTTPSIKGQVEVIKSALKFASVDPSTIDLVEAHGTGTLIGDPVEIESLKKAYNTEKRQYCAIGSIKSNLGHLDTAAGMAGMIKVVMALKNKVLPPTINCEDENPKCDFEHSPFYVNKAAKAWESTDSPRRAAVSSFGIGGTNGHVILEEYVSNDSANGRNHNQLLFSTKYADGLAAGFENIRSFVTSQKSLNLADIAYTLKVGRSSFPYRSAISFSGIDDLIQKLEQKDYTSNHHQFKPQIVFAFPGQGSQYYQMGLGLYQSEPYFKSTLDNCFELLGKYSEADFKSILFDTQESDLLNQTIYSQPLLFSLQYSLARLFMYWGVNPDCLIGHSIGEYVAACISGIFSLENALYIVTKRGELMQSMKPGDMLLVKGSVEQAAGQIQIPEGVNLAAINSPRSYVYSGPAELMADFARDLDGTELESQVLNTSHAFHSGMMEKASMLLEEFIQQFSVGPTKIPFFSNLTGELIQVGQNLPAGYWSRQLASTVKLEKGLDQLLKEKKVLLIEVGTQNSFKPFVRENRNFQNQEILSGIRHAKSKVSDEAYLSKLICDLWLHGVEIDWTKYYEHETRTKASFPTYPFKALEFPFEEERFTDFINGSSSRYGLQPLDQWYYHMGWQRQFKPAQGDGFYDSYVVISSGASKVEQQFISKLQGGGQQFSSLEFPGLQSREAVTNFYAQLGEQLSAIMSKVCLLDFTSLDQMHSPEDNTVHLLEMAKVIGGLSNALDYKVFTCSSYEVIGDESINLGASPLNGALKVIPQEYEHIRCQQIDLQNLHVIEESVVESVLSNDIVPTVAVRNKKVVWTPSFVNSNVGEVATPQLRIEESGVYVILGGMGKVGLCLAEFVLKRGGKAVLLSRSTKEVQINKFSDWSKQKWNELIALGEDKIECLTLDISELDDSIERFQGIEQKYGRINGVFHAAGNMGNSLKKPISNYSEADVREQFGPKVFGLQHLSKALEGRDLDFVILTSSLASVLGGLGYFGYSAANAYMDAYAQLNNKGTKWLAVNFDGWSFEDTNTEQQDDLSISPDDSEAVFSALSKVGFGTVAISTHDLNGRWEKWVGLGFRNELQEQESDSPKLDRPDLEKSIIAPKTETEKEVADRWKEVFGYAEIGVEDNFFELGGDSLKALSMINFFKKSRSVSISMEDFFTEPTVRAIAEKIDQLKPSTQTEYTPIPAAEEKELYKLSPAQSRQYFIQKLFPDSRAYNQTSVFRIEGALDRQQLEMALSRLVERHEPLRTVIYDEGGELYQKIQPAENVSIHYESVDHEQVDETIASLIKPFDLSQAPLIRMFHLQVIGCDDQHFVGVDLHHSITDGITNIVLFNDLMGLYFGNKPEDLRIQYKDYAEWISSEDQRQEISKQESFWLKSFEGSLPILALPTDFSRPEMKDNLGDIHQFEISPETSAKIALLAKSEQCTPFAVIYAFFSLFLSKLSQEDDIVIGTPSAGRNHPSLDKMVGFFVNTLSVRSFPTSQKTFLTFLGEVKNTVIACFENQNYPFESLVDTINPPKDPSRNPIFDVFLSFESFDTKDYVEELDSTPGLSITKHPYHTQASKFDLTLHVVQYEDAFGFAFEYANSLFKPSTIARFSEYLTILIDDVLSDPSREIGSCNIVNEKIAHKVKEEFNHTLAPYSSQKTVIDLFEEQVAKTPNNIAIREGDATLTYREFSELVNRMSGYLRSEHEIKKGDKVAVMLERETYLLVSIYAIFKAGALYVPIDPHYPLSRKAVIIEDANCSLVITRSSYLTGEEGKAVSILDLDTKHQEVESATGAKESLAQSNDLAYIIFTSGTTGRPKGVMVEHHSLVNRLEWGQNEYQLSSDDVLIQKTSITFDVSLWELFWWSISGASLSLLKPGAEGNPKEIINAIDKHQVTVVHFIPSLLRVFLLLLQESKDLIDRISTVNFVFASGEALKVSEVQHFKETLYQQQGARLINLYGPTEATIEVAKYECSFDELQHIPIGKPIQNVRLHILNKDRQVCPVGVPGALYIGGVCVTRGYIGQEQLTSEKFVTIPSVDQDRLYNTGDIARWKEDGNIEYMGRVDDQVKIRGFRIELGDIESHLVTHELVKEAVVLVKDHGGEPFLVAYYVSDAEIEEAQLRGHLAGQLPGYMVPAYFVWQKLFLLTPNGKLDRRALPDPEILSKVEYVPASDETEEQLVGIWSQVLKLEPEEISVTGNFFALGGHSLNAVIMVNKLQKETGVDVSLQEFFKRPTIQLLAKLVGAHAWVQQEEDTETENNENTILI